MIVTYQLGSAKLIVDGVGPDMLGHVINVLKDDGSQPERGWPGVTHPIQEADNYDGTVVAESPDPISLTPEQRAQIDMLLTGNDPDPLDDIYTGPMVDTATAVRDLTQSNGQSAAPERQHLETPDLDDADALARIAFDAYMIATGQGGYEFDNSTYKEGWRAVAGAVKTAATLQQVVRAAALGDA